MAKVSQRPISSTSTNVCFWHKADIDFDAELVCFRRKADIPDRWPMSANDQKRLSRSVLLEETPEHAATMVKSSLPSITMGERLRRGYDSVTTSARRHAPPGSYNSALVTRTAASVVMLRSHAEFTKFPF